MAWTGGALTVGAWFCEAAPVTVMMVLAAPEPPRPSVPEKEAVNVPIWLAVGLQVKVPVLSP